MISSLKISIEPRRIHTNFDFKDQILHKINKKNIIFISVIIKKNKTILQRCDLFIFKIHESKLKKSQVFNYLFEKNKKLRFICRNFMLKGILDNDVFEKESLEACL